MFLRPPPSGQVADAVVASSHEDRAIPEVSGLETGPTKSSTAGKATLGVERGDPAKNAPVIPARPGKGGADPHVQEAVAGKASGNQQADGKELPAKKVSEKHQSAADGGIQSAAPSARLEPSPDASQRAFAESKAPVDSSGVTKGEKPAPTTPASLSADRVTAQRVQQAGPGKIALVTPSSSSLQSAVITSTQPELGSSVSLEQAREKDEPGNSVGNASPIPHVGRLAENQPVKEGGAQKPATGEVPHPEMHAPAPRVQGGQPAPGKANREISEEQASQRQTEPEKQLQTEPESRLQVQAADPFSQPWRTERREPEQSRRACKFLERRFAQMQFMVKVFRPPSAGKRAGSSWTRLLHRVGRFRLSRRCGRLMRMIARQRPRSVVSL